MKLDTRKSLFDLLEAIDAIQEYTANMEFCDFRKDGMAQAAVERKFEIIGEALNRIAHGEDAVLARIPGHQRIIGFRNVIAHGYDVVDVEIVWEAVVNHVPLLRDQVHALLDG